MQADIHTDTEYTHTHTCKQTYRHTDRSTLHPSRWRSNEVSLWRHSINQSSFVGSSNNEGLKTLKMRSRDHYIVCQTKTYCCIDEHLLNLIMDSIVWFYGILSGRLLRQRFCFCPSVCVSVLSAYSPWLSPGAACDAASVHFNSRIRRTDTLVDFSRFTDYCVPVVRGG